MKDKKPTRKPLLASPAPSETDRLFRDLRARYEASITIEPDVIDPPPMIHILQANYALGKSSEAALGDSPTQTRRWALELALHSLHLVASIDARDAGEDEEE